MARKTLRRRLPRRLFHESLESRRLLAAVPVISEFMADNTEALLDAQGRSSDWIEIHNTGDMAIDLEGWYLTDDPNDLRKWSFPSRQLGVDQRIVVFASGDGVPDEAGNPHTNFALSDSGEFLALVRPDGVTIAHSYDDVPEQRADVSYGIEQSARFENLIDSTTPGRFLVPDVTIDTAIGSTWRGADEPFDDSSWHAVDLAVGFEDYEPQVVLTNVARAKPAAQSTSYPGFSGAGAVDGSRTGNSMSHTNTGDTQPWWEVDLQEDYLLERVELFTRDNCCTPASPERDYNLTVEVRDAGGATLYTSQVLNPWNGTGAAATNIGNGASFVIDLTGEPGGGVSGHKVRVSKQAHGGNAHSEWLHIAEVEAYARVEADLAVNLAEGKPTTGDVAFSRPTGNAVDGNVATFTHSDNLGPVYWQLDLEQATDVGRVELVNRADGCCAERLNGSTLTVLDQNMQPLFVSEPIESAGVGQTLVFDNDGFGFLGARFVRVDQDSQYLSIAELRVFAPDSYDALIGTDVEQLMLGVGSSAYLRQTFELEDASLFDGLTLSMNHDDGFVAYLNGQEIARRNAPAGDPGFDAAATDESVGTLRADYVAPASALRDGVNVLAVHGMNRSVDDTDFLLLPRLVARYRPSGDVGYLVDPTPGSVNGNVVVGFVGDTKFDVDRGFFDQPFDLRITSETPGATIIYTTDGSPPNLSKGTRIEAPDGNTPPVATIPITTTSTIRAAAFKDRHESSNVDTQTYLFLEDVIRQGPNPVGLPSVWDGIAQDPIPADYEMDQEVVNNPAYSDEIVDGLRDIRTMSIVMDPEDLFGSERGIYINSGQRGAVWEHATSVEIIDPNGESYQADSGIRIHGFSWRFHGNTPKHSFRLEFRDEFGPSRMEYPLFPDAPVDRFDSIVLRAQGGRAWAGLQRPAESQYIRDTFARDTARDMGKIDGHATFVHLYLNGVYWGLYNPVERPDAQMGEEYFGGSQDDYDALNRRTTTNEAIDGDLNLYNEMLALADAGLTTPEAYEQIQRYVDIDNLIDFFLIHQYTTNQDGPETFQSNNQRAIGSRVGDPMFRFFVWDMEYSIWNANDNYNIDVDVPTSISHVYTKLRENPEFRLYYADRVHMHMFNGGALTPEKAAARWETRATEIERAIISESARWGDAKRAVPYTRDVEWQAERNRLLTQYFPFRTNIMLGQLRSAGLYPNVWAPAFSEHGGQVEQGFPLEVSAPFGAVYYTLDGSDPRLPGGAVSPSAILYDGPVSLDDSGLVKARALQGDDWSALNAAEFFVNVPASAENLAIAEIHYNPPGPTPDEAAQDATWTGSEFEFVELRNVGQVTVDLSGARFTSGIEFDFTAGDVIILEPGARVVVVRDREAFEARYGTGIPIAGVYSGGLSNSGEQLELLDRFGATIHAFQYDDEADWPGRADGNGSSLELVDVQGDYDDGDNWRSSVQFNGSPGAEGLGDYRDVVVNEVLSHTDAPQVDAIELYNGGDMPVDIGGWLLSDSSADYGKFAIPAGTTLAPGQYVTFDETDFNPTLGQSPSDFSLDGAHGDDVWLLAADAAGKLLRFADRVEFGAQANGESWARWPNGSGQLYPSSSLTLSAENAAPRVGPLVISEIMYNPRVEPGDTETDPANLEFLEIHNPTSAPVDLTDWRIRGGVDYDFPAGSSIDAGSVVVVVAFDPSDPANEALVEAFRTAYDLSPSVELSGGYSGQLSNGGESVRLLRPDEPPVDEPGFVPGLQEDRVDYDDEPPWPASADGIGSSLTKSNLSGWSDDPANWIAIQPTPGRVDTSPPRVLQVSFNSDRTDPPDLPSGAQGTSWSAQRSYLADVRIVFSQAMRLSHEDVTLVNLGIDADVDPDSPLALTDDHLRVDGNVVTLSFAKLELADGVYRLTVAPTATDTRDQPLDGDGDGIAGDAYVLQGNQQNRFYQLAGEFNGDMGVSIFDFTTFAYWFGNATVDVGGRAPEYVDLSDDLGISIFDFNEFAANFGASVRFPSGLSAAPIFDRVDGEEVVAADVAERVETARGDQRSRVIDRVLVEQEPGSLDVLPVQRTRIESATAEVREADEAEVDELEALLELLAADSGRRA